MILEEKELSIQLTDLLKQSLQNELIRIQINDSEKDNERQKIKIRPVKIKEQLLFQMEEYRETKVFHKNYEKEELLPVLEEMMEKEFRQMIVEEKNRISYIRRSKKGKITIRTKKSKGEKTKYGLEHNRIKKYILEEGKPIPFLIDLGVMNKEGVIVKRRYDKFRQINRYLEFIRDIIPYLPKDREIQIVDFGCGKSYLTFAVYYYLSEVEQLKFRMIGLDLKADVIETCSKLRDKYRYDKLDFQIGDIAAYEGMGNIDLVVSLHACDTATDYAIYKAIQWRSKVILAVPCCQHEVNAQINSDLLAPLLQYGLLKERFSAITTDAVRAQLLETEGYQTSLLEFIDMEHTPKNVLIRAVRTGTRLDKQKVDKLCTTLQINPKLKILLEEQGESL